VRLLSVFLRTLLPLYAVVIGWLSLAPVSGEGLPWDKALHFVAYSGFAGLLLPWTRARTARLLPLGTAVLVYSALLELAQHSVPGRSMDGWDLLANGLGITVGLGCCWLFLRVASDTLRCWVCGVSPETGQTNPGQSV
jgi:VanZ family protein